MLNGSNLSESRSVDDNLSPREEREAVICEAIRRAKAKTGPRVAPHQEIDAMRVLPG
jgi:hypothetical protein